MISQEDRGAYSDKCPGDVPWIPGVCSCMRPLSSNDLTEPETWREKSLTVWVWI